MRTRRHVRRPAAAILLGLGIALSPDMASGATGDLYAADIRYCASTYSGHPTLPGFGLAIDLNADGGDYLRPVYAPFDGQVTIYSSGYGGGWGNSIILSGGGENLHVAHLESIVKTGSVRAGDKVALAGSTGKVDPVGEGNGAHLHVARQVNGQPASLVLSGRAIQGGACYVSAGSGQVGTQIPDPLRRAAGLPVDFDGDGRDDVFWYGPGGGHDTMWFGAPTRGSFDKNYDSTVNGSSYVPIAGDFNGDRRGDIFWYGPGDANDAVWYGTPTRAVFDRADVSVSGAYVPVP